MQLVVACECGKLMVAPSDAVGRMGRCPDCGKSFLITEEITRPVDEPADPAISRDAQPEEGEPKPHPDTLEAEDSLGTLMGGGSSRKTCPSCGESNSEYTHMCWKCSASLEPEEDSGKPANSPGSGKSLKYVFIAVIVAAAWFVGYAMGKAGGSSDKLAPKAKGIGPEARISAPTQFKDPFASNPYSTQKQTASRGNKAGGNKPTSGGGKAKKTGGGGKGRNKNSKGGNSGGGGR
ncbi:hypothetical protein ACFL1X_01375 [Candidatus Hydrogenedentota bacterium]